MIKLQINIFVKKQSNESKKCNREIKDNICCLTINRPKHLNALNKNTIKELGLEIINAQKDKSTRCIIITGSENKAFVAGMT